MVLFCEDGFEIHLTKEGIEFLKLKNNVISSIENGLGDTLGYEKNLQSISDEEVQYILDHIKKTIKNEHDAMIIILDLIDKGENSAAKLEVSCEGYSGIFGENESLYDMNRNGVVARLTELRLINSHRSHQSKVEYILTEQGTEILKKERSHK